MSGSSIAISQNTYAKIYNGMDVLTIMNTDKSLKGHAYDSAKKAWTKTKKGKAYIYDKTWGLTDKTCINRCLNNLIIFIIGDPFFLK